MSGKTMIGSVLGLLVIILIVVTYYVPPEEQESSAGGFTSILYGWSSEQSTISDQVTDVVTEELEGSIVGEDIQGDGSNWSIPNILRYWLFRR